MSYFEHKLTPKIYILHFRISSCHFETQCLSILSGRNGWPLIRAEDF